MPARAVYNLNSAASFLKIFFVCLGQKEAKKCWLDRGFWVQISYRWRKYVYIYMALDKAILCFVHTKIMSLHLQGKLQNNNKKMSNFYG